MIIKSLTRTSRGGCSQLCTYVLTPKERLRNEKKETFLIRQFIKSDTPQGIAREFLANEKYRQSSRKGQVYLYHTVLSFAKDDHKTLTNETLRQITKEYLRLRCPSAQAIAVPHHDTPSHIHVHVVFGGIAFRTGEAMRISKTRFQALKAELQLHQLEYGLTHSVVAHRSQGMSKTEWLKNQTHAILALSQSKEEFFHLLKEHGFQTYERGSKTGLITEEGKTHRFDKLGLTDAMERFEAPEVNEQEKSRLDALSDLRAEFKEARDQPTLDKDFDDDFFDL